MKLVKVGGHLCLWTPANNELGHGFYQLGPELFHRLFCEAHGYRLRDLVLVEQRMRDTRWYRVADPARLGARVGCVNSHPLFFMVLAQRVGDQLPDHLNVQQADYVEAWKAVDRTGGGQKVPVPPLPARGKGRMTRWIPSRWEADLKRYYRRYWVLRLGNRTFFEPVSKQDYHVWPGDVS
ncbi:MAG TPA: hypothetical protein PKE55_10010 [Kiritimatiellia bacterium]|nr:hypothetical protein [Kiritimatiellia bacterium]